jgi:hypothetical protein
MENTQERQTLAVSVSPGYLVPRRKTGEEVRFPVAGEVSSPVGSWERQRQAATADRQKKHAFVPRKINQAHLFVLFSFAVWFLAANLTLIYMKVSYPEPPKELLPPQPWSLGQTIKTRVDGKGMMWFYAGPYGWVDP